MEQIDIEGITPAVSRMGWSLDEDVMQAIESIVAEHVTDPAGPELMARPSRDDRKWDRLERLIA